MIHRPESASARSARAVAALNHPHICTLHDIGRGRLQLGPENDEEIDFLVLEYLQGQTLRGPSLA